MESKISDKDAAQWRASLEPDVPSSQKAISFQGRLYILLNTIHLILLGFSKPIYRALEVLKVLN